MSELNELQEAVIRGDKAAAEQTTQQAIDGKIPTASILKDALIPAMQTVGDRFSCGEAYIPDMLISARAMKASMELLRPHLVEEGVESTGKVVIGTVKGDLHDIGKNLVAMMLEGAGFEVIDLGADVSPEQFVEAVQTKNPDLVGLSALLTTTMVNMKVIIDALKSAGVRDGVKVVVGGAPVTEDFAAQIGADGYSPEANGAVRLAKSLVSA